jgi:hypothetical protein
MMGRAMEVIVDSERVIATGNLRLDVRRLVRCWRLLASNPEAARTF